ncbi:hypothetical protein [Pseudomonas syringae]|uniref:hypothetical protein n=1 Tax=Pseudomonas syringae TaxID=317 RepID=UPI0012B66098|nr:hypothetical protein [Pseudomonas syringae]
MKNLLISIIALCISMSANAEYIMKVNLEKEAISFKQYYDNVGIDPNDNNNSATDPSCIIKNTDFVPFNGQLLKTSTESVLKCVVDIIVPKAVFDPECNTNAAEANTALWDMMRSKGVDGVSSVAFYGECQA